jgi:alkylation response protein AidB-like acyl-CoA dehydrogenase
MVTTFIESSVRHSAHHGEVTRTEVTTPSRLDPVGTARALGPTIADAADWIERERRLPPPIVEQLRQAGFFRMLMPASVGGGELDLPTYTRVVEEVARADASTAWCVGQGAGLGTCVAYASPEVAAAVFTDPGISLANGPGVANQPGRARATPGGYRVTGRWMFASGCLHATWMLAICELYDADGNRRRAASGQPELRSMLVPRAAVEIVDIWHVSGLRGTGSNQFEIADLFVPEEHALWLNARARREPGPLYLFPASAVFGPCFSSLGLGVARAAIDAFVDQASGKTPRGLSRSLRDSPVVQSTLARAEARLGAARAYLRKTLREVWDAVSTRGELRLDQRVALRLAATHGIHEAAAVVDVAYELAGSHAIFADQAFERRFRDVHAVTQQLQGRAAHFETVGRFLLGLEPDTAFL